MTPDPVVGHQIGEAIRGAVPPWLIPLFVLITRFGNPAFFVGVFALDYWFGDHRRGAHALALAIGGYALITALKTFFDAPRPPAMVNVIAVSGYSFPSGHATSATIGYGILAHDMTFGSWRSRYSLAGVLILLVALSRVVLGVHYVRDVVAGIVVGTTFLVGTIWLTKHDPERGFAISVLLGVAAVVISGLSHDGVVIFGAAIGAALTWRYLDVVPRVEMTPSTLAVLAIFAVLLGGLAYVGSELHVPLAVAFVLNVVVMVGVLVTPHLVSRSPGTTWSEAVELP